MSRGMRSKSWWVKPTNWPSIQWPDTKRTSATPASLGTNVSVTSWIWVTDWNSEMAKPIARLVMRMGAQTLAVTVIIRSAISITVVSVMVSPSVEARKERLDYESPAVDEY